ncbi:cell wall-binding repeat-containing protein [Microbacterium sp.]|uniref:cell wall-binding repeat-containing protein n=1 Tax=Microbacterium sp. TaxID=51671 RepID=UPI0025FAE306|nr:cell wall-binding repeat-containing protein [Microbacterium sp.]
MIPRIITRPSGRARAAWSPAAAVLALVALIGSLLASSPAVAAVPAPAVPPVAGAAHPVDSGMVETAAEVGFNAGNIITDALFYDGSAMTASEIQAFLDAKIGACTNGKCLNVLSAGISSRAAVTSQTTGNLICSAIQGGTMKVSELIYRVQVACGVSAKVILVTLQKEQGLTTSKAPSDWNLSAAMGASCPDTAPCDPAFAGVGPQILKGTQQLKTYKAANFAKQPGVHYIAYSPSSSCGGSYVNIQNYATAALYNYTPYQPNAAALAAGYGLGDSCSAYGNRNFYNYYTSWFGSTQGYLDPCRVPPAEAVTAASGEYSTTASLNGRAAPSTDCAKITAVLPSGTIVTRVATYGVWWNVRLNGVMYWVHSDYLTPTPAVAYTVDRIEGADRYETAAAISTQTNPQSSATVYLASGEHYPDSVVGSPLAAHGESALLMTSRTSLPPATASRLVALKPSRVVVLGGTGAVADDVLADVRSLLGAGVLVDRIAGVDRYDTARLIVKDGWTSSKRIYLATGRAFSDALSASSAAAIQDAPVLLVDGAAATVAPETIALLRSLGVTDVVLAGGSGSISDQVETELRGLGLAVDRKGGSDRFATSLLLALAVKPSAGDRALVASGLDFPDALSGAVLSGATGAPLLLQPPSCMSGAAKNYFITSQISLITLLGGPSALGATVESSTRC